jgi:predicted component of type VI protein secretion system
LTALSPRLVLRPAQLNLTHGDLKMELSETTSVLNIGRDAQSDIVIMDRKASRMHARIERRRDKFVLIDHSSNGTYVTIEGEGESVLRREEFTLRGRGHISFGHAFQDDPVEFVGFICVPGPRS